MKILGSPEMATTTQEPLAELKEHVDHGRARLIVARCDSMKPCALVNHWVVPFIRAGIDRLLKSSGGVN